MLIEERTWDQIPDVSDRLQQLLDYTGLSTQDLAARMNDLGVGTHVKYLAALAKGSPHRRTNPTHALIWAISAATGVGSEWFFANSADLPALMGQYAQREQLRTTQLPR